MTSDRPATAALDPETPVYRAYRSVVAARWTPATLDVSEDRVRIAGFDDEGFASLRSLLARCARLDRGLLRASAGLAAVHRDARAMALAAVADAHATRVDFLVRYWERVVDAEEHARGNDLTGLTADRWLADADFGPVDDLVGTGRDRVDDGSTDADTGAALGDYLLVEGVLARGTYGLLRAAVGGEVGSLPALPGLAAGVESGRSSRSEIVSVVTTLAAETGGVGPVADPEGRLRDTLPAVPAAVPVDRVVRKTLEAYRGCLD